MRRVPPIHLFQSRIRHDVCARCPWRTPGTENPPQQERPCEQTCTAFQHLPEIIDAARQCDPMVGSRRRCMALYFDELAKKLPPEKIEQLKHNKDEMARLIQEIEDSW